MPRRLLFVDDEPAIRVTLKAILANHGYEVTTAATVAEGLQKITSETFDILISDLNIGNPGDGLTIVSAMRRTQPEAVTMILTGYPAFETALEAIRQQVDDYIVKPANIPALISTIENKLASPPQQRQFPPPKRVSMILQENAARIEELWLAAWTKDHILRHSAISGEQRLEHLRAVLNEVIHVFQTYTAEHLSELPRPVTSSIPERKFTPNVMLAEFCVLRRVIAQVVQENLLAVNLSYVVPDLACVNESLDDQAQSALTRLTESTTANG
ncbi:MAG TPA: response regulator [Silvibacterium sp.]|nr:response regulator [Silvibacterium sp.]